MPVGAEGGLDGEGGGPPRTADEARRLALPTFVMDLPVTRRALTFAEEHHRGQLRDVDRAPFILHPLEVAQLLRGRDYPDEVVAAGVLHDIIEDAHVAFEELRATVGLRVAALVRAVSEPIDASGSYRERKARLRAAVAEAEATRSRCSPPTRSPSRVSCAWDWCAPAASLEDADRAQEGQRRLAKVAREEHANDRLVTRGNVLTVGPRQTPAQARIVDECLKES